MSSASYQDFVRGRRLTTDLGRIGQLAFSPSGTLLACGDDEGCVHVFAIPSGSRKHKLVVSKSPEITALLWHNNPGSSGNQEDVTGLLVGTSHGTITVIARILPWAKFLTSSLFQAFPGIRTQMLRAHHESVVALDAYEQRIASATEKEIKIWSVSPGVSKHRCSICLQVDVSLSIDGAWHMVVTIEGAPNLQLGLEYQVLKVFLTAEAVLVAYRAHGLAYVSKEAYPELCLKLMHASEDYGTHQRQTLSTNHPIIPVYCESRNPGPMNFTDNHQRGCIHRQ